MLGCVLGVEPAEEVTDDVGSAWGAPAGQSGTTYSAESNGSTDMMVVLFGASWGVELRVFGRVVWRGRAPEGWAFATAAWCCNSPPGATGRWLDGGVGRCLIRGSCIYAPFHVGLALGDCWRWRAGVWGPSPCLTFTETGTCHFHVSISSRRCMGFSL